MAFTCHRSPSMRPMPISSFWVLPNDLLVCGVCGVKFDSTVSPKHTAIVLHFDFGDSCFLRFVSRPTCAFENSTILPDFVPLLPFVAINPIPLSLKKLPQVLRTQLFLSCASPPRVVDDVDDGARRSTKGGEVNGPRGPYAY